MASSSRKKRARKGGDDKGHGENERNEGRRNEKRRAKTGHDEKALAKQRRNEAARKRYAEDADYREKLLAYRRAYKREHRGPRPPLTPEERARQTAREKERYATDPDFRAARLASQRKRGRKKELKHRYGLSWEDYQAMLARQDGKCAICKCEFTDTPSVDHCHLTRKVRRLLCVQYRSRPLQGRSAPSAGGPAISVGISRRRSTIHRDGHSQIEAVICCRSSARTQRARDIAEYSRGCPALPRPPNA